MNVGTQPDSFLAAIADREALSYADALRGYAMESLLRRIYESDYGEFLWLRETRAIGSENYRRRQEACLEFYYVESTKYIAPDKVVPGVPWTDRLVERMQSELFEHSGRDGIAWTVERVVLHTDTKALNAAPGSEMPPTTVWTLGVSYQQMHLPLTVKVTPLLNRELAPEQQKMPLLAKPTAVLTVYVYSVESRLAEYLFEIIKMLELISDMGAYDRVNQILKKESISGRHIMELLEEKIKAEPRLLREKRIDQLAGYRDYTYMAKRWEQYERRHAMAAEPWTEVIGRVLRFVAPVWRALCRKEVFFDDWMPELSRFLG
jgi:hypothetical protein